MTDLADILRIVAKHASACADELDGITTEDDEPSPGVDPLAEAKRLQAERHAKLTQKK